MSFFWAPTINTLYEGITGSRNAIDATDQLNLRLTPAIMIMTATAIYCKQLFGSPMQCWLPREFGGSWEAYAHDYCFISDVYYVPFEENISDEHRQRKISYYRWIPIVLVLQALMYTIPGRLWYYLQNQTALNLYSFIDMGEEIWDRIGKEREKNLYNMSQNIISTLQKCKDSRRILRRTWRFAGSQAAAIYIISKLLTLFNLFGQLVLTCYFLGVDSPFWGWKILFSNKVYENTIFPLMMTCDFEIRNLGQIQKYSTDCVTMLNAFNSKFYTLLYFWNLLLILLTTITTLDFLMSFFFRPTLLLPGKLNQIEGMTSELKQKFLNHFLYSDGLILLYVLRHRINGIFANNLMHKIVMAFIYEEYGASAPPDAVAVYNSDDCCKTDQEVLTDVSDKDSGKMSMDRYAAYVGEGTLKADALATNSSP
ncbi:unnamed protein product [Caenorhabditis auriculariae]|uniref:Innexin n=1 Tax=Caenorhabditis auriculariae TaxID=2777116 RepID=A0A8S1GPD3_9PELO|nr:unnamed protein product [Caenorhabditis auriculariae]